MKPLTPKQEKFCQVYMETSNATEAYRQAYNCANMKPKSINEKSCRMLTEVKIRSRIQELQEQTGKKFELKIEKVIQGVLDIAENGKSETNRLKAHDMLIKHLGGYLEKLQVSGQVDVVQYYAPKKDKDT